jgi:UDP-N-acetylmuramoyl-tripeptide--D-alanyl-D-alanine ligase
MIRTIRQIAQMAGAKHVSGNPDLVIEGVSTDSRTIHKGCLFVPLVGDAFDGHHFAESAIAKGAAAVFWQQDHPLPALDCPILVVEDTLQALQKLAHAYRKQLPVQIVAITGSNGKTSTKDMIAAVLQEAFIVQKTQGNLNNHIGVPLTLLSLREETQVAVVEMGMNHAGEIQLLARLAEPDIGVITNIGDSHIEFFGSRSGIAEAKWELIDGLDRHATAILLGDEPLLKERRDRFAGNVIWFGSKAHENDVYPIKMERKGLQGYAFQTPQSDVVFRLPVLGLHQVTNALAAISVGRSLGMDDTIIAAGLEKVELTQMRMQVVPTRYGWYVINDAYNASPTSMKAAFRLLGELTDLRKIAVLGDMLELGDQSDALHTETGRALVKAGIDELLCIGEKARYIALGAIEEGMPEQYVKWYNSVEEIVAYLISQFSGRQDIVILVKGSRGMKMERVVDALVK